MRHLALLLALMVSPPAFAQSTSTTGGALYTANRAVSELLGDDPSDAAYAARWLYMRAKSLARKADRGSMEGRAAFDDLRRLTVRPLTRCVVGNERSRRYCADALGLVGDAEALPALQEALVAEDRPKVRAHVQAAIDALGSP